MRKTGIAMHIILIIPLIKRYDLRRLSLASLAKNNVHKSSERSTVAYRYTTLTLNERDTFDNYERVIFFTASIADSSSNHHRHYFV